MRENIIMACTECQHRNYCMSKNKKKHPDRFETKKYCPFCHRHTVHRQTK
ncbi:50S ribosomal protein L33 [bacterium]|nr:50S ribosomal protein L33 [bacterium]